MMTTSAIISKRINQTNVLGILNTLYSVFLGLAATQFYERLVDARTGYVSVNLLINQRNAWPVALLTAYFVLDWLSTNLTVEFSDGLSHWLLLIFILFIASLGAAVVFAFEPSIPFYIAVFGYAAAIPIWDVLLLKTSTGSAPGAHLVLVLVILTRATVGAFGLAVLAVYWWVGLPTIELTASEFAQIVLSIYVGLKILRYWAYLALDVQ